MPQVRVLMLQLKILHTAAQWKKAPLYFASFPAKIQLLLVQRVLIKARVGVNIALKRKGLQLKNFFKFYWNIVDLQYCISFRCTAG